jgi:phage-related protein
MVIHPKADEIQARRCCAAGQQDVEREGPVRVRIPAQLRRRTSSNDCGWRPPRSRWSTMKTRCSNESLASKS